MQPCGLLYLLGLASDSVSDGAQDVGWFDKLLQDIAFCGQWKAIV